MSFIVQDNSRAVTSCNDKKDTKSSYAQEQEINDLVEFLKLEYRNYIRYKILYGILEDFINEENECDLELKVKVQNIMTSHNASKNLIINPKNDREITILGLKNIVNVTLSYTERNHLTEALKIKIEEKNAIFNNYLQSLKNTNLIALGKPTENCSMTTSLNLSLEDKLLLNYREKLLLEQEHYVNNLLQLRKLLKEITKLRLKQIPETVELRIKEYQMKDRINQVKSVFTEQKCRLDIFRETNYSLKAYKELIEDIKNQQQEYRKEIGNFVDLKQKYVEVSCKQYQDILHSYLQYRASIERKKRLYDCLKK